MRDDDRAALVAMAGLPDVGPARLRALAAAGSPAQTWRRLVGGGRPVASTLPPGLVPAWREAARRTDPGALLDAHRSAGIGIVVPGDADYPEVLRGDRDRPAVLFHLGDPRATASVRHTVAIVGTRRSTAYGEGVARRLGAELAAAGVSVCSGLALGIDGAAHHGVLSLDGAPPVAVVGNGLDRPYPARHRGLWQGVASRGVIWSEAPLGAHPVPWRFPSRNRLIAALGEVLVVVESPGSGGSFHTVREADDRGRTVMAVPGPVGSRAAVGTNQLLADGCPPCRDVADVSCALGLRWERDAVDGGTLPPRGTDERSAAFLESFAWEPCSLDDLAARGRLDLGEAARMVADLIGAGLVQVRDGLFERVGDL